MSWRTKEKIREVELNSDKLSLQELFLIADRYETNMPVSYKQIGIRVNLITV